jgi:hypothetical protein
MYFDSNLYLRQMMVGGSLYTPDWYISLAHGSGDPYSQPVSVWEIPGTATPLTTAWVDDPSTASLEYLSTIMNDDVVDVEIPANTEIRYWVIRNELPSNQWQWIGRFNNYPLSVSAGDIVRFSPGSLKISIST